MRNKYELFVTSLTTAQSTSFFVILNTSKDGAIFRPIIDYFINLSYIFKKDLRIFFNFCNAKVTKK